MTKEQRAKAAGAVALLALALFALLYGVAIIQTLQQPVVDPPRPPSFGAIFTTIATTLSGAVGGVVAVAFGVTLPAGGTRTFATTDLGSWFRSSMAALGEFLWPKGGSAAANVARLYIIIYLAIAVLALLVVIRNEAVAPELLKNLVLVAIGLIAAVASSLFVRK